MAVEHAVSGLDHPTAVPENFDPETDDESGREAGDGADTDDR